MEEVSRYTYKANWGCISLNLWKKWRLRKCYLTVRAKRQWFLWTRVKAQQMLLLRKLPYRGCSEGALQCTGCRMSCATLCVALFASQEHLLPATRQYLQMSGAWVVARQFSLAARLVRKSDQGFSQNKAWRIWYITNLVLHKSIQCRHALEFCFWLI